MSFALLAAACSDKKDDTSVVGGGDTTTGETTPRLTTPAGPVGGSGPASTAPGGSGAPSDPSAATTPATTPAPAGVRGGTLRYGVEAEAGNPWTPAAVQCDSPCYQRAFAFYDALTVRDDKLGWKPFLAESVTPNDDFTEWTITLREGITFHDGEPFDADAAIYNLQQQASSFLTAPALADIARRSATEFAIDKVDPMTFTIKTGRDGDPQQPIPWPQFPFFLSAQIGFMGSPKWLEAVKERPELAIRAVGTGPFKWVSQVPGDRMVVERNEDYWMTAPNGDQLPYLDRIEFTVLPDAQVRETALTSGDVDVISSADGTSVSSLLENDNFETEIQDQLTETSHTMFHVGGTVGENGRPQPWDVGVSSREVRCALIQGTDRELLNEVINNGYPQVANGVFSPGQEGYLEETGLPAYEPEAASAAIEAYEAENGPVTVKYMTTATGTTKATADFLEQQWEGIGVDVETSTVEQSTLITNAVTGVADFEAFGWRNHGGIYVDQQYHWWAARTANTTPLALNFGRMRDDVIDEQLAIARSTTDAAERRAAAEAINRRFGEQCYVMPTWWTVWGVSHTPQVQGFGTTPLPDGDGFMGDGAGFPGQVWLTGLYLGD